MGYAEPCPEARSEKCGRVPQRESLDEVGRRRQHRPGAHCHLQCQDAEALVRSGSFENAPVRGGQRKWRRNRARLDRKRSGQCSYARERQTTAKHGPSVIACVNVLRHNV